MLIGVPREVQSDEYRVALTPAGADVLVQAGHEVVIETGAGFGSGFRDDLYKAAGCEVVATPDEVWKRARMIMKVKEPTRPEWPRMRRGQVIFTYLHLAADEELTRACLRSRVVCIAYETVALPSGELPLLTPTSEIAGRMAVQEGARFLEKPQGGQGVLLGGVPGVLPGKVVILGGGVVGTNAAKAAAGLGARVCIIDSNLPRLRHLDEVMPKNVTCLFGTPQAIRRQIEDADLVIGAVLVPGARTPCLIRKADLRKMKPGAVVVDVAVDQGGCVETTRPTTHRDPVYVVGNVVHYAVPNMPGAVPRTSTLALTNATLPYAAALSGKGWKRACLEDAGLKLGVDAVDGKITHRGVAGAFGMPWVDVDTLLQPMSGT